MLGLFSIFGRSQDQQLLDQALRNAGLHPRLLPDAVKITTIRLMKSAAGSGKVTDAQRAAAAELLAYGTLGPEDFAQAADAGRMAAVEERLEAAIETGDSLDAQLILLLMHAGQLDETVTARYSLAHG